MAKFYGTVTGLHNNSSYNTQATRLGYSGIRASAQTWEGSLIVSAYSDKDDIKFTIEVSNESNNRGEVIFDGTLDELKSLLERK